MKFPASLEKDEVNNISLIHFPLRGITVLLAAVLMALPAMAAAEKEDNREQANGHAVKAVVVSTDNQNQEQTQQRFRDLERRLAELAGLLQALQQ